MAEPDGPIDAVIAWVDGADPAHRARLERTLAAHGIARPASAHPTRFNDAGELEYCLASILRHAPWFRRIHVVTDAQTPAVLHRFAGSAWESRVRLVDHREIFAGYERYLPTFNSRAICSMLWRIDGLADRYVYFNDDMALLRPVRPQDFFRDDKVVQRGAWRRQSGASMLGRALAWWKRHVRSGPPRDNERAAQERSAQLAGFGRRYYRLQHTPYPFRRATLETWFAEHPDVLEQDLAYPFRRPGQFRAECLSTHLEIARGGAVLDNRLGVIQLKPRRQSPARVAAKLARADRDAQAAFVCVQSLEMAPGPVQARILAWLDRRVGRLGQMLQEAGD